MNVRLQQQTTQLRQRRLRNLASYRQRQSLAISNYKLLLRRNSYPSLFLPLSIIFFSKTEKNAADDDTQIQHAPPTSNGNRGGGSIGSASRSRSSSSESYYARAFLREMQKQRRQMELHRKKISKIMRAEFQISGLQFDHTNLSIDIDSLKCRLFETRILVDKYQLDRIMLPPTLSDASEREKLSELLAGFEAERRKDVASLASEIEDKQEQIRAVRMQMDEIRASLNNIDTAIVAEEDSKSAEKRKRKKRSLNRNGPRTRRRLEPLLVESSAPQGCDVDVSSVSSG